MDHFVCIQGFKINFDNLFSPDFFGCSNQIFIMTHWLFLCLLQYPWYCFIWPTLMQTIGSVQLYLKTNISWQERSVIARLWCGVFPLHIETGWYRGTPADRRCCKVCMSQSVEDEIHFLLHCLTYSTQRDKMLTDYQLQNNCDFTHMSDSDKLITSSKYQC
jgi:hypothetical protein